VPADDPTLVLLGLEEATSIVLPQEEFAYAGQYRMKRYGKAVLTRRPDRPTAAAAIIAALSTDRHRIQENRLVVRTIDVRREARGNGWGPLLLRSVLPAVATAGFETIQINVNNPFAYIAACKAGFGWTGRTTGLAELIMTRPTDRPSRWSRGRFIAGLSLYRRRRLDTASRGLIARYRGDVTAIERVRSVDDVIPVHHTSGDHG